MSGTSPNGSDEFDATSTDQNTTSAATSPAASLHWRGSPILPNVLTVDFPDRDVALMSEVVRRFQGLDLSTVQGRLVEGQNGSNSFSVELTIPISESEGERILLTLVADRSETPGWEVGSVENDNF